MGPKQSQPNPTTTIQWYRYFPDYSFAWPSIPGAMDPHQHLNSIASVCFRYGYIIVTELPLSLDARHILAGCSKLMENVYIFSVKVDSNIECWIATDHYISDVYFRALLVPVEGSTTVTKLVSNIETTLSFPWFTNVPSNFSQDAFIPLPKKLDAFDKSHLLGLVIVGEKKALFHIRESDEEQWYLLGYQLGPSLVVEETKLLYTPIQTCTFLLRDTVEKEDLENIVVDIHNILTQEFPSTNTLYNIKVDPRGIFGSTHFDIVLGDYSRSSCKSKLILQRVKLGETTEKDKNKYKEFKSITNPNQVQWNVLSCTQGLCDKFIQTPFNSEGKLNIENILNFLNSEDKKVVFLNENVQNMHQKKIVVMFELRGLKLDKNSTVCYLAVPTCKLSITVNFPGEKQKTTIPIIVYVKPEKTNYPEIKDLNKDYQTKYYDIFTHSPANAIQATWQFSFLWILNVLYEGLNQGRTISDILVSTIQRLEGLAEMQNQQINTDKYTPIKEYIKKNAVKAISGIS